MTNKTIGKRGAVVLFSAIVLLLTLILLVSLRTSDHRSTANAAVPLSEFGYKEYVNKGPFVIHVDEDFPAKRKYMFIDQPGRIGLNNDHGEIILNMDAQFSVDASFDPKVPGSVSEYSVTIKGVSFTDLDANGSFDYRFTLEPARRVDVWYQNTWRETVVGVGTKYEKKLVSGDMVSFEKQSGVWSRTSDLP